MSRLSPLLLPPSPLPERVRQPVNAPIKGKTSRWMREIDTWLISREPHRVSVARASRDYTYSPRNIDIQGVPPFTTSVQYHLYARKDMLTLIFLSEMLKKIYRNIFTCTKWQIAVTFTVVNFIPSLWFDKSQLFT